MFSFFIVSSIVCSCLFTCALVCLLGVCQHPFHARVISLGGGFHLPSSGTLFQPQSTIRCTLTLLFCEYNFPLFPTQCLSVGKTTSEQNSGTTIFKLTTRSAQRKKNTFGMQILIPSQSQMSHCRHCSLHRKQKSLCDDFVVSCDSEHGSLGQFCLKFVVWFLKFM